MRTVRLGDICDIVSGGTPSRSNPEFWQDGKIPWIKIGNIKGKHISEADEYVTQKGLDGSSAKMLPKGTILYTIFATLGEVGILDIEACTNQAIAGITVRDPLKVQTEYLYYYLKSKKNYVNEIGRGVAQNNINMSILRNFSVPIPKIEEQKEIVSVLSKEETIISARKQQLSALDDLIKARFVKMFGDPLLNPMNWKEEKLEEIADIVSGITKGRKVQSTDLYEVPYMAVSNVKDGYIDWTTVKTILATQAEIDQYRLLPNDVLMTEGGDPDKLGRGAIIHEPPSDCIHQNHIFRVRLNQSRITPEFMGQYLQHQKAKRYFLGCAKQTTGIASINMKQLRALPMLMPPIGLQREFAAFVAQIDKSKSVIQKSLDETQILFDSLMQKYFG